jgi:hypothetical protein
VVARARNTLATAGGSYLLAAGSTCHRTGTSKRRHDWAAVRCGSNPSGGCLRTNGETPKQVGPYARGSDALNPRGTGGGIYHGAPGGDVRRRGTLCSTTQKRPWEKERMTNKTTSETQPQLRWAVMTVGARVTTPKRTSEPYVTDTSASLGTAAAADTGPNSWPTRNTTWPPSVFALLLPGPATADSTGGLYDVVFAEGPLDWPSTTTVQRCPNPTPGSAEQYSTDCPTVSRVQVDTRRTRPSLAALQIAPKASTGAPDRTRHNALNNIYNNHLNNDEKRENPAWATAVPWRTSTPRPVVPDENVTWNNDEAGPKFEPIRVTLPGTRVPL